ncbi:hypothetical protein, partial [Aeromonas rivipollensis]|uniref:hypothetical protein n=1 Tax=Aeromonas rivipollensis TaxID=948519 RepID=UPI003D1EA34E
MADNTQARQPSLFPALLLECFYRWQGHPQYIYPLTKVAALAHKNLRHREFNFEVQFPIKNQAAFRSSSKTTC